MFYHLYTYKGSITCKGIRFFDYLFALVIFTCLIGCTPHVRYTRPSRSGENTGKAEAYTRSSIEKRSADTLSGVPQNRLKEIVDSYMGVRHRSGGTTRKGMDCSGFVWRVYTDLGYKDFKRTSSAGMCKLGRRVSLRKAKSGDLVFFKRWLRINHVGIYMGKNIFAHASLKNGVTYTSLDDEYFGKRFVCIRRIY